MTPDDPAVAAAMLGRELSASLSIIRNCLAKGAPLPRPEAEAWTRIELFAMASVHYLNQLDPIVMQLIHDNIATALAAYHPRSQPGKLT